jgi:xanthine phosphoribosyltransferase
MEALREKIRQEGEVVSSSILKVDSFLNHQIDAEFMMKIGKEFASRFQNEKITKVMTIEASGIAPALCTAAVLGVPVVFAKKTTAATMDAELYIEQVKSFTRGTTYDIKVAKKFLNEGDQVLIIDDFLAYGHAALGLAEIVRKSGAQVVGIGAVIEKGFQSGGKLLRDHGIRVESLAIVEKMEETEIIFK